MKIRNIGNWLTGSIGIIDQRIDDLTHELSTLKKVRQNLWEAETIITTDPVALQKQLKKKEEEKEPTRKSAKGKRKLVGAGSEMPPTPRSNGGGSLKDQVASLLTTSPQTTNQLTQKLIAQNWKTKSPQPRQVVFQALRDMRLKGLAVAENIGHETAWKKKA
jgi:hypothetical protein